MTTRNSNTTAEVVASTDLLRRSTRKRSFPARFSQESLPDSNVTLLRNDVVPDNALSSSLSSSNIGEKKQKKANNDMLEKFSGKSNILEKTSQTKSNTIPLKDHDAALLLVPDNSHSSLGLVKQPPQQQPELLLPAAQQKQKEQGKIIRPSPLECAYVVQELGKLHPNVLEETKQLRDQNNKKTMGVVGSSCGSQKDILDGVISTMLSQNTTNANSTRAFANLKTMFPNWSDVTKLETTAKLEDAIKCAGLAQTRAKRIMELLKTLESERQGPPSLEYIRDWSNEDISKELIRFPGLGKKTISCVLLFTLGREEFPVDTHVHRISKQLHWVPSNFSRDDAYDYLNQVVPPSLKLDLHCLLIGHGRVCHRCAARGKPQFPPKDGSKLKCPLVDLPKLLSFEGEELESGVIKIKKEN